MAEEAEPTYAELLADAKRCMKTVLTNGQAYTLQGRALTRANLPELRALIMDLEELVAQEAGGSEGTNVLVTFQKPR